MTLSAAQMPCSSIPREATLSPRCPQPGLCLVRAPLSGHLCSNPPSSPFSLHRPAGLTYLATVVHLGLQQFFLSSDVLGMPVGISNCLLYPIVKKDLIPNKNKYKLSTYYVSKPELSTVRETVRYLFKLCACLVTQSCPALCNPLDCSPAGSSIQGISQAKIQEWVAISYSRGSSRTRDQTHVSYIADELFTIQSHQGALLIFTRTQ